MHAYLPLACDPSVARWFLKTGTGRLAGWGAATVGSGSGSGSRCLWYHAATDSIRFSSVLQLSSLKTRPGVSDGMLIGPWGGVFLLPTGSKSVIVATPAGLSRRSSLEEKLVGGIPACQTRIVSHILDPGGVPLPAFPAGSFPHVRLHQTGLGILVRIAP